MMRRTLILTFFLAICAAHSGFSNEIVKRGDIEKDKDLFSIKAEKNLLGATVEIYSSTGQLITSQELHKRRIVIDFGDVKLDTYTIRITKGDIVQVYQYTKF